jgi:hypothetical protein
VKTKLSLANVALGPGFTRALCMALLGAEPVLAVTPEAINIAVTVAAAAKPPLPTLSPAAPAATAYYKPLLVSFL